MIENKQQLDCAGTRAEVVSGYFLGAVDNAFLTKTGARLLGWSVVNPENRPAGGAPAKILVVSEGAVLVEVTPSIRRKDIADKFGEQTLCCGFDIEIPLELIPAPLIPKFDVFAYDGGDVVSPLVFFRKNDRLQDVVIRSGSDFMRLIQNFSTRITDKPTLVFTAVHAMKRFPNDYAVRAAALCTLGYRVLDHEVNDPEIVAFFDQEAIRLLEEQPAIARGLLLRWHTSVRLIAGYLSYQKGNREAAIVHFDNIAGWFLDLPKWPQALTNVLLGVYISGYLLMESGRRQEAVARWAQAEAILRFGSTFSEFMNYYAYGELENAVKVARDCHMARLVVQEGGPLHNTTLAPDGIGLDPRTVPGPIGRLSAEYRERTNEMDPLAEFKGVRVRKELKDPTCH